jgi:hypothetical protein
MFNGASMAILNLIKMSNLNNNLMKNALTYVNENVGIKLVQFI